MAGSDRYNSLKAQILYIEIKQMYVSLEVADP